MNLMNTQYYRESRVPFTICIVLFLVTFFINNDFEIGYLFNYIFVSGFIACSLLLDSKKIRLNKVTQAYFMLSFVVIIFSFMPNSVMDPESNNHAISIFLFFICCVLSCPSTREIDKATGILLIAAFIMAVYTIMVKIAPDIYWNVIYPHMSSYTQSQAWSLMRYYNYGVPIGGSANYADYIFALGLFICCGKLISGYAERKKEKKYIILAIIFILGMIIQNRRSELMATVITLLLMYLLSTNFKVLESRRFRRALIAIVVIIIGTFIMYSRGMLDRYINTIITLRLKSGGGLEEAGNGRIALWKSAIEQFQKSPVFGIGWNQFRATNTIKFMEGINVHNDYLQWLCETGIVGFVLLLMPTVYIWLKVSKRTRKLFTYSRNSQNEAKYYVMVSYGIQTYFIIMHFLDPCFYKLMFWPMFSLSIIFYNLSCSREIQANIY